MTHVESKTGDSEALLDELNGSNHSPRIPFSSKGNRAPYTIYRETKTFGALNGLRAFCCLAVVKEHSHWTVGWPKFFDYGYLGVDIFFVISGFLIVTLMLREEAARGTVSIGNFYIRRALRIFPVYYLVVIGFLLFYFLYSYVNPNGWNFYKYAFPFLLTYTQDLVPTHLGDFFHTWSLAMEEQFYLLWPAIQRFLMRPAQWFVLGTIILISQVSNFGYFDGFLFEIYGHGPPFPQVYQVTFTPIALGVALAYLLDNQKSFHTLYRLLGMRWSFLPILVAGITLLETSPVSLEGWPRLGIQLIFALLLASLVVRQDHYAMRFLRLPVLSRIGAISYGMYVYHVFIIGALERTTLTLRPPVLFFVASLITISISELSYRFVEGRFLKMRGAFRATRSSRRVTGEKLST